ncbi:MAG: short-chain dehydrogenase [Cereibacter sphaeroides]|uniref:Short-chain dehydrogenase n=1 Tax=Cereibacter sphaeroides TaxID=1063 RepID=A0A2W5SEX1_CERSP|nr:MAG: short-chain dehydrogenase [Cereibacter sphaeroides]
MAGVMERVALVTGCGAADGIGFATARALSAAGARVAMTSTTARIFERLEELGPGHIAATADLTRPEEVASLFADVEARLGPVAVLVNNAGMVQSGKRVKRTQVGGLSDAAFGHHLALNVGTTFNCIRAALPAMQAAGYGRIVNMASVTGPVVTIDGSAGYATAKAAITGLTRATALEYGRHGITCNAVLPGWIQTGSSSAREIRAGKASPAARPGTPAEVAACCLFLASTEASYVNGAMLVVDGANTLVEMKGAGGL